MRRKIFYGHQLFVQNIHFEMYNKIIQIISKGSDNESNELSIKIENLETVKSKRNLITEWSSLEFNEKLVASACLHGLFFTSVNLVQDWLKLRSTKTPMSHEFIEMIERMNIDQDLERDFACLMISHLRNKPTREFILKMIDDCSKIEYNFLIDALQTNLLNFTPQYVKQLLEKRIGILKIKLLNAFQINKTAIADKENEKIQYATENKLNHQKLFDHDF